MASSGRCLCGAVQYTLNGEPISVLDCHCSMCRRESGAASLVYAGYRRTDVSISGSIKYYRASNIASRGFCPNCGSPICYEDDADPQSIWLTVGTHDDAGSLPVAGARVRKRRAFHGWRSRRTCGSGRGSALDRRRKESGASRRGARSHS